MHIDDGLATGCDTLHDLPIIRITDNSVSFSGARFNKEVQPTRSLNLNSELSYSEMGNSEFSVTERLNCVSLLNSK